MPSRPGSRVPSPVAANDFPVICVGGSAGGLDAYIRLLRHLPCDLGVAVVIVNHLRETTTRLHDILPNYTRMPVELITERLAVRPNRAFIIPPRRDLHVMGGRVSPQADLEAARLARRDHNIP